MPTYVTLLDRWKYNQNVNRFWMRNRSQYNDFIVYSNRKIDNEIELNNSSWPPIYKSVWQLSPRLARHATLPVTTMQLRKLHSLIWRQQLMVWFLYDWFSHCCIPSMICLDMLTSFLTSIVVRDPMKRHLYCKYSHVIRDFDVADY